MCGCLMAWSMPLGDLSQTSFPQLSSFSASPPKVLSASGPHHRTQNTLVSTSTSAGVPQVNLVGLHQPTCVTSPSLNECLHPGISPSQRFHPNTLAERFGGCLHQEQGLSLLDKVFGEAKATELEKCIRHCKSQGAGAEAGIEIISNSNHDKFWPCLHPWHPVTRVSTCMLHKTRITKKLSSEFTYPNPKAL